MASRCKRQTEMRLGEWKGWKPLTQELPVVFKCKLTFWPETAKHTCALHETKLFRTLDRR